jgi:hypothetical protein
MSFQQFDEVEAFRVNGIEYGSAVHEFYKTYRESGIKGPEALNLAIQTAEKSINAVSKEHQAVMRTALYNSKD